MADLKTLASQVSEAVDAQDGTWQKKRDMLKAVDALRVAAMGPAEYIAELRYQPLQNMCVMIALEMGILASIVEQEGKVVSGDSIATATGSDKSMIVRMMRMLTALSICNEVGLEQYTSNANAEYLNTSSRQGAWKFINGPTLKVMANIVPYMRANGGRYPQFPDRSKNETGAAEFTHGMNLWELFRKEPEVLADFVAYLTGRREDYIGRWFDIFPAREHIVTKLGAKGTHDDKALIVDVGGNVGYDLQEFRSRFPQFKGKLVLQDLSENIEKAKGLLEGTGIECMEYDFFTPQPVKGALYYVFCGICHDWPDEETKKLLSNTAAAMDEHSTLIIDEMPLPDENAPLDLVTYDILMMVNVCGIERTIGQYRNLLDEIGLELVNVYSSPLDSVLEIRLKR